MRRANFAAVMTAALALTAGPAAAQSGSGAGTQAGTSGTGSGQSNPTGGQAGTSGAGTATAVQGGGQSSTDEMSRPSGANGDQQFVQKAALSNMVEIQLGQLGVQKAQDPQVKEFAQMMVDEHTKALAALRAVAGSAELPTAIDTKHQKVHDTLATLQGAEFDRKYMDAMVDAHKDAEKLLKKGPGRDARTTARSESGTAGAVGTSGTTSTTSDASATASSQSESAGAPSSIGEWVSTTLPKVQSHLQQARSLEDTVKQSAQRPNTATPAGPSSASDPASPGGATPPRQ